MMRGAYLEDCDNLVLLQHPNVLTKATSDTVMNCDVEWYLKHKKNEYCPVVPTQAHAKVGSS